ncbi:MAG TPA: hypothetical protein VNL16_16370 [Chloroflexota bacterium]|nr:hypothetical protein [Chloroflexota bacterium]
MSSRQRSKAPWRWVVIVVSGLATAGIFGAILNGPTPTHASPPPTPVVVQPAPSMSQLLNQDQGSSSGDLGSEGDSGPSQASQSRFVTRGS